MDFMDWEERNNGRSERLLLCNFSKIKEENIHYFSVSFTLDSLKILPKVGSSIVSKPNLSPPSLPHLLNLPNLPNLLNLLTQNATKAPSSDL
jgi:hypothetical protein